MDWYVKNEIKLIFSILCQHIIYIDIMALGPKTVGLGITGVVLLLLLITAIVLAIVYGVKYGQAIKDKDALQASIDKMTADNNKILLGKQSTLDAQVKASVNIQNELLNCSSKLGTCSSDLNKCNANLNVYETDMTKCVADLDASNSLNTSLQTDLDACNTGKTQCTNDLKACDTGKAACMTDLGACNAAKTACSAQLIACKTPPTVVPVETTPARTSLSAFTFVQGYDYPGSDIKNTELIDKPEDIAKICSATMGCQGFNTHGWIKKDLKPHSQVAWKSWEASNPKRGFYILNSLASTYSPKAPIPEAAPEFINYKFSNAGNYCLDVTSAKMEDGAYINAGGCNTSQSQFFYLNNATKQLKAKHSGKCVTAGATGGSIATQKTCGTTADQKWTKVPNTDGTFTLKNDSNSLCLTSTGSNWGNVTTTACTNANTQKLKN